MPSLKLEDMMPALDYFLENDGSGKFEVPDNGYGFKLKGEVRSIIFSNSNIVVGRNSDSIAIFKYLNE